MCVILHLPKGTMPEKEHLFNAVHNNWHSWGIVLKDAEGKMQMYKDCPEGGNNPETIWAMLDNNKDIERALHVRHTTKGSTSFDNAQPFEVYSSNKRQVFFMHNGTLNKFGGTYQQPSDISDTRDFCNKILVPSLSRWHGENGEADYLDKMYWEILLKDQWSSYSKGLFISNDLDILCIGDGWKKYNEGKNGDILTSNTDYFDKITRGPVFEEREKERRAKLAEAQSSFHQGWDDSEAPWLGGGRTSTTTDGIKEYRPSHLEKSSLILNALKNVHKDVNFEDHKQVAETFKFVTFEEIADFILEEGHMTAAALFDKLTDALSWIDLENTSLKRDNDRLRARLTEMHIEGKDKSAKAA